MSRIDSKLWLAKLAGDQRAVENLIEHLNSLANLTVRPEMEACCADLAEQVNQLREQLHLLMGELRKGTQ